MTTKTTHINNLKPLALAISLSLLSACGGGGGAGDSSSSGGDGGIIGTATIPQITNLSVEAKSKSGKRQTTSVAANGSYKLRNTKNETYLLRTRPKNAAGKAARDSGSHYLYSIAHSNGSSLVRRNIHPFTDLIIRNWFATKGLDINNEFEKNSAITQLPTLQEVNAIESEIEGVIKQVLKDYGVNDNIDLLATPFSVNGQGFDKFLKRNPVVINNNQITLIFNQPNGGTQSISINGLPLNKDFTAGTDTPPTTPTKLRSLAASNSEIVVVWQASTDDKGVRGYNIYRNGALVGTSPFPVYSDTGLSTNTNYSYQVEAIDSRGQTSARTTATSDLALNSPDTTAPPAAAGLSATATGNDITLNWTQSQIDDVASFRVLRGSPGNANTQIAQITSTGFTDFNLPASSTAYCYRIKSSDAADNESAASNEACANVTAGSGGGSGSASLSFSNTSYQVSENASSITITVNRRGDIGQAVSVHYAATGGSATAGIDFTATSGTLTWAANDSSPKTFSVQISADAIAEGNETVQLQLSSPSGASILTQTATLTINDAVAVQCIDLPNSTIDQNTTLSAPCYKAPNGISVNNPAKLTISPGVKLMFGAGEWLEVNKGASLYAVGTSTKPILFTGQDQTPGYWKGIQFYQSNSSNNKLEYVTVEYGEKNIDTVSFDSSPARFSMKNSVSRYASNVGVYIFDTSVKLDAFKNNTLTANNRPITLPADMVGLLGKDSSFSGNTDDRVHVYDSDIVTAQTWKKLDIPYYFRSTNAYNIKAGLTLEAGTTLIFNSGSLLEVDQGGSLNAVGTVAAPILFTGQEKNPGYWDGIQFYRSNSNKNLLNHVIVEYGVKNIDTVSFDSSPTRLSIKNTLSHHASDLGLYLYDTSIKLDAFENVTLTDNDRPISLPSNMVGKLGTDSTYSGNTDNRIHIFEQDITTAQTWKKLDVPYFLRSTTAYDIDADLTIEAGSKLIFNASSGFDVNSNGSLKAIGTASNPITFTGLEHAQGYWQGIEFYRSNSSNNILDYVIVEDGGSGNPANSANIHSVCFPFSPTRFSVTNSTIKNSAGWGIYRYGTSDDGCFITLSGNSYGSNVSGNVNTP